MTDCSAINPCAGNDGKVLIFHPTGNPNSRNAARAFLESDSLLFFAVSLHLKSAITRLPFLGSRARLEIQRRSFAELHSSVKSFAPFREAVRILNTRAQIPGLFNTVRRFSNIDAVSEHLDQAVAGWLARRQGEAGSIYCYEDCALHTLRRATDLGLRRFYELPIGYWRAHRRLCAEEASLMPTWAHTWPTTSDDQAKLERKDKELASAERIIVPSDFVAETLLEFPGTLPEVSVVPYGCPTPGTPGDEADLGARKLRVLFVGNLSQRKGLAYMVAALEPLRSHLEVTAIGSGPAGPLLPDWWRRPGNLPHPQVIEQMRRHDVFVFPSLFEGYSLAVAEALSQGLIVIATRNSGAGAMIESGSNGWFVPIRDAPAITARLEELLARPALVSDMKCAARTRAATWQWADYRSSLLQHTLGTLPNV